MRDREAPFERPPCSCCSLCIHTVCPKWGWQGSWEVLVRVLSLALVPEGYSTSVERVSRL